MSQPSIKKNFLYKSALTLSSYLMAFVTFPYVSRVLGVERIGLVNFVDNTINYFLLFATLGVNILGVREIAAVRENEKNRNKVYSELLGVNILFTLIVLIVYILCVEWIPKLNQYKELFYIGISKLIFTAFLVEWLYTGLEQFRYITLRSIAVKLLYVLTVFLFIRSADDYKLYFILTIGVVVLNAIVNVLYAKRFVNFDWRGICSFHYMKQDILLGIYSIMTSMYLTFNVMYLGLVSDNVQVGYYTTAHKLYMVVLGFFSAFTQVMLPRMSALIADGKKEQFHRMIKRSFKLVISYSVPLILISIIFAPEIIQLLSGTGYEGAVLPMRIIMPAVLFVGIAQVSAVQVLIPLKRDSILLFASIIGAALSLAINLILVTKLQSVGSAIVLLSSECAVTLVYMIYVKIVVLPWMYQS